MCYTIGEKSVIDRAISNEKIIVRVRSEGCYAELDFWRGAKSWAEQNYPGGGRGDYRNTWLRFDEGSVRPRGEIFDIPLARVTANSKVSRGESCSPVSGFSNTTIDAPTRTMNPATLFTSGFTRRRSRLFPEENRAVSSFHGPACAVKQP